MIRKAKQPDLKRLVDIGVEIHKTSLYKDIKLDRKYCLNWLTIVLRDKKNHCIWVDEIDGQIEGFIIGSVQQLFFTPELLATDLMFGVTEKGKGGGAKLMKKFISWAEKRGDVRIIIQYLGWGVPEWERTGQLYERLGLGKIGAIYTKEL